MVIIGKVMHVIRMTMVESTRSWFEIVNIVNCVMCLVHCSLPTLKWDGWLLVTTKALVLVILYGKLLCSQWLFDIFKAFVVLIENMPDVQNYLHKIMCNIVKFPMARLGYPYVLHSLVNTLTNLGSWHTNICFIFLVPMNSQEKHLPLFNQHLNCQYKKML